MAETLTAAQERETARAAVRAQLASAAFLARVAPRPGGCRVESRQAFKALFRRLCQGEVARARAWPLPPPPPTRQRHALLLEFRPLPHVEVVLRQAMRCLGPQWAHTLVCGPDNEACMRALAPPGVQIMCLPWTRNMTLPKYNRLLTSAQFWQALEGEHVLLHQEDTLMFLPDDLTAFLEYDFVGAPWPNHQVGNGGFSLRKRSTMLRLCRAFPATSTPEDVHFQRIMRQDGHCRIAPESVARQFSVENLPGRNPVAGHQWWWAHRPARWAHMAWAALDAEF